MPVSADRAGCSGPQHGGKARLLDGDRRIPARDQTVRWREPDSNPWSPLNRRRLGDHPWRLVRMRVRPKRPTRSQGGTDGSNPLPSSGESTNHRFLGGGAALTPRPSSARRSIKPLPTTTSRAADLVLRNVLEGKPCDKTSIFRDAEESSHPNPVESVSRLGRCPTP